MIRLQRIWEGEKPKLNEYLDKLTPGGPTPRVLLIFWHGAGDAEMFLNPFLALKSRYPNVILDLAVQKGLGFEDIFSNLSDTNVRYIDGSFFNDLPQDMYDIIADIDFPMSEGQTEFTKGEWCCIHELGIPPVCGHMHLDTGKNRLIGVHFNITCLPDAANPDHDTAKRIWDDILSAGFIPIETHFQHVFHNPVNAKFDFVDCTVRRVQPRISTLIGLLQQCAGFVGVVSGNLHIALSVMPRDRIFFLDKDLHLACFIKDADKIPQADLRNYKGEVKQWLLQLEDKL